MVYSTKCFRWFTGIAIAIRGIICMLHTALARITDMKENVLRTISSELSKTRTIREGTERVLLPALRKLGDGAFEEFSPLLSPHVTPCTPDISLELSRTYGRLDGRPKEAKSAIYASINRGSGTLPSLDWLNVASLREAFQTAFREKQFVFLNDSEVIIDVRTGKSARGRVRVLQEDERNATSPKSPTSKSHDFQPTSYVRVSHPRFYLPESVLQQAEHSLGSVIDASEKKFYRLP